MGRVASSPRVIVTSPSPCFCSWSTRSCHIMPSERRRRAHRGRVIRSEDRSRHYLRLHRFLRPGDGTSGEQGYLALLQTAPFLGSRPPRPLGPRETLYHRPTSGGEPPQACAPAPPSPASCRAAWPPPAQRLRAEKRTARVSRMCAAS